VGDILEGVELDFVRETFDAHYKVPTNEPKYSKEEITGVVIFQHTKYLSSRCFALVLDDDVVTFSLSNLKVKRDPRTSLAPQRAAFRIAIGDQIQTFREKFDVQPGYEVDHEPPFCKLRSDFLDSLGISLDDVQVRYNNSDRCYELQDESLKNEWEQYHRSNARLQAMTREENRQKWLKYLATKINTLTQVAQIIE